jgi:ABC-type sugar transport system substrate-binding protein
MLGEDCVEYIEGELGGEANVAFLSFPVENTLNRQAGFEAALDDAAIEWKKVSDQNFEGSRETAVNIIENIIQAGTDFDVVWAAFTSGGLGAATALEAANHKAKVWCCGGYGEELFDIFKSGNPWYMADYVVFPRVYVDTIFDAMDKVAAGARDLGDVYSPFPVMNQKNFKELLGL